MDRKGRAPFKQTAPNGVVRDGNGVTAHELPHSAGTTHVWGQSRAREHVFEIQRARILAAMVEECAARGAANVTVAHVVERAGVSRRTFYELFSDWEDCFLAAFNEGVRRASHYVLHGYDPRMRWNVRIRTALTGLLSFLDAEPGIGRLLIVDSLGAGARTLERRQRVLTQMAASVDEGRRQSKAVAELPPLTAEGVVGGVLSVLHSRLLVSPPLNTRGPGRGPHLSPAAGGPRIGDPQGDSLLSIAGPLMGMIVLPYLGLAAARRENAIPIPKNPPVVHHPQGNPLGRLEMRLTYRTVRVLMAIAAHPGSSNRVVADAAEVSDQGQMSKLLARLHGLGLIENTGGGGPPGGAEPLALAHQGAAGQGGLDDRAESQ